MSAAKRKFLFDTDFAGDAGGKPAESAITLAEHGLKLAEAEAAARSGGYADAQSDAQIESGRRMADALEHIAAGLAVANGALDGNRNPARMRGGRGCGGGGAQARAGLDRARAVRRNLGSWRATASAS